MDVVYNKHDFILYSKSWLYVTRSTLEADQDVAIANSLPVRSRHQLGEEDLAIQQVNHSCEADYYGGYKFVHDNHY